MGKPIPGTQRAWYVLVTAAHVFDDISGDTATIVLRKKQADSTYKLTPYQFPIRAQGKNLYEKHPDVDVAALVLDHLPTENDIPLLGYDAFAEEDTFEKLHIHPGNNLTALGYPLGAAANEWGFAILRSGKIASYPLLPIKTVKTFLFDFRVFSGNSGGPVFLEEPRATFAGPRNIPLGGTIQFIVGLVTQQLYFRRRLEIQHWA
jgi:trypsin-like peptidase